MLLSYLQTRREITVREHPYWHALHFLREEIKQRDHGNWKASIKAVTSFSNPLKQDTLIYQLGL